MISKAALCPHIRKSEDWADIHEYIGIYQISNWGRLKSLARTYTKMKRGGGTMTVRTMEVIRSIRSNNRGYLQISLFKNGASSTRLIHILVATYFVPNPDGLPQVLHIDDDPSNAYFENLKWGTQSDNILDCISKNRGFVGSKNGNSKLKETDIPKIRQLLIEGKSANSIAPIFGVAKFQILSIKHGRTWKQVK